MCLLKVPLNTKQTNKHVLIAMYEPLSKGIKDAKCRRLQLSQLLLCKVRLVD